MDIVSSPGAAAPTDRAADERVYDEKMTLTLSRTRRGTDEFELLLEATPSAAAEARTGIDGLSDRLPAKVYRDLRVVVTELITNAVRFGPGQPIVLTVRIRPGGRLSGAVSDGGTGGVRARPRPAARGGRHGPADRRRPDPRMGRSAGLERRLVRARRAGSIGALGAFSHRRRRSRLRGRPCRCRRRSSSRRLRGGSP